MTSPPQTPRSKAQAEITILWREFAESLGIPKAEIPSFVADRIQKEQLEREFQQKQLEIAQAEVRNRREREAADRQTRLEREEIEHQARLDALRKGPPSDVTSRKHADSNPSLSMPPFDETKEEIELYLKRFERVASVNQWKEDTWAVRLSTCLTGRAAECYMSLDDESCQDYEAVKTALLARYQLTADVYRRRFRSARKKDFETHKQFGIRLTELLAKWHALSGINDLEQLVLLDQYFHTLSSDTAAFVRERTPTTLKEATAAAEIYAEAHRSVPKMPPRPRDAAHGNAEAVKGLAVNSRSNQNSSSVGPGDKKRCFKCDEIGHVFRNCPLKSKPPKSGAVLVLGGVHCPVSKVQVPVLCQECSTLPFTPRCEVRVEGVVVQGLRDTGSDICLARSSLVPPTCLTGAHRTVRLADKRTSCTVPVAKLHIESPYFVGSVEAVVLDEPCADFVVGNSVRMDGGDMLPVYAVSPAGGVAPVGVSVVTRGQAAKEGKPPVPLRVPKSGLGAINSTELGRLQREDDSLVGCRESAEKQIVRTTGTEGRVVFRWRRGVLYRGYSTEEEKEPWWQIVVPESLRKGVLSLAHEPPMAGHLGQKKTLDRIWKLFYWPGLCTDVRRFVGSCDQCQKVSPRPPKVPLEKMPLIDTPFERVAVDLTGPLPMSGSGNRYILVLVDYATRYPEAIPLKSIEASVVAEALWQIWTRMGIPAEILTDRGTQFTSELMREMNRLLAIRGLTTTPYHAQTNGLVERFNGTLKLMLRKLTEEQPKQWDRFVPALLFAYREVVQESLGFSPFELLYGRTVRGPMQILRELWVNDSQTEEVRTTIEYVVDLRNRIEETCKLARENLARASVRQAEVFNRRAAPRTFEPGDKVLLLLPEERNKLQMRWQGPFEVLEKKGTCDYRISVNGKPRLYHANLLKKYVERKEPESEEKTIAVAVVEESEEDGPSDQELPVVPFQAGETADDIQFGPTLTDQQKTEALHVAYQFEEVLTDLPHRTHLAEFDLTLESAKPVRVKQYPLPYAKTFEVRKEVEAMKQMGVIEQAASPYNAPVVLVRKKDGNVRFCVDYRRLNDVTVFDAEPLPDVEQLFASLGKSQYFTKIDLSKGYWQIPISEACRPMTAFTTPAGQFQFTVMPFGLKNAVAVFSRMMRALLDPLNRRDVYNFMDDILVANEDWKTHLEALRVVFQRLKEANLSARPKKCFLGFEELSFLGHVVRKGELLPEEDKLEKIRDAVAPQSKKEVRAFLGMAGYYRKFVPNFSTIALPLSNLTKKFKPNTVVWTPDCERAFQTLKSRLVSRPVLRLPDLTQPFVLRTDASAEGLGAVLLQESDGVLHPVAYASRKLIEAEIRYSTIEKECLAVVWATQKFQAYLYGQQFVLETDHQPLSFLKRSKVVNSRLMRWSLLLQSYNFVVRVIPGSKNVGADYLSRSGVE
jgi:transposase InsO family protein